MTRIHPARVLVVDDHVLEVSEPFSVDALATRVQQLLAGREM
jgi:hypothetical protein